MAKKRKKKKSSKSFDFDIKLHPDTQRWIFIILFFVLAGVSLLSLLDLAGSAGLFIDSLLSQLLGYFKFLFPILFIYIGILVIKPQSIIFNIINGIGLALLLLGLTGIWQIFIPLEEQLESIQAGVSNGGYVGLILAYPLLKGFGFIAGFIFVLAILIIGVLLFFNRSSDDEETIFGKLLDKLRDGVDEIKYRFASAQKEYDDSKEDDSSNDDSEKEADDEEEDEEEYEEDEEEETHASPDFKKKTIESKEEIVLDKPIVKKVRTKIEMPLDLLDNKIGKPTSGNIALNKMVIKKTLESFNIPVEMGEIAVGPTVTQYTLKPAEGVKLSKITSLQDDLALSLAAHPLRIEAPIPGKSLVGIEVPNKGIAVVQLRELMESNEFKTRTSNLNIPLGKDVAGNTWVAPLEKMPHLLVAGATGSGKSVCLHTIISSLLFQNSPDELKFILVDPKRVELPTYNNIPYLLTPVITDVKKTLNALKWTMHEMDKRYELLEKVGKRNIESYNKISEEKMPYIVFVIDELADLMVTCGNEVEAAIIRLAQMARAVGIHLILATQRPSVDVITGLIKANFPSRIAFAVTSITDSRTILDSAGAEKLLGRGDMLYTSSDLSKPKRLQGAFLSDKEIKNIVKFLKDTGEEPDFDDSVIEKQKKGGASFDFSGDDGDELFDDAKELVIQAGKASTSFLQRRLKVGYSRAARLIDLLEEAGIVGPADGAKPREILTTEIAEEDYEEDQGIEEESSEETEYDEDENDEELEEAEDDEEEDED